MNDLPRQTLRNLIARFGPSLCEDPKRCKGLLQDACPAHKREVFALVSALEEQIVADLLAGFEGQPCGIIVGRLAHRLADNRGLADGLSLWAVESWALALGMVSDATVSGQAPGQSASAPQQAAASDIITTVVGEILLKLIPAGEFWMGSPDTDHDAGGGRKPRHKVRISNAFYLGLMPLTQAQYQGIIGKNPSQFKGMLDNPVENLSWFDATAFCNELSRKEGLPLFYSMKDQSVEVPDWGGRGYRLPTEAEWEHACRAGTETRFCFGDDPAKHHQFAWCYSTIGRSTQPVGRKFPNAFGVHDMHGNVSEWCWDRFDGGYYWRSPGARPHWRKCGITGDPRRGVQRFPGERTVRIPERETA